MRNRKSIGTLLIAALTSAPLVGCESLPGGKREQGAVIGGVGGAAAGAVVAKDNRAVGALIGGLLGAGGGFLIGQQMEKKDRNEALEANRKAEENPATPADVGSSDTADLNRDGFVTMDEVVALERSGLNDREIIRRLESTQQIFDLNGQQEQYLKDHGLSQDVIVAMRDMNRDLARRASDDTRNNAEQRISRDR